jgi:hypothetical protein
MELNMWRVLPHRNFGSMATEPHPYCARLNVAVPRVEDFVDASKAKLFDLLVVALLERNEPMSLEAVASRLLAAGVKVATATWFFPCRRPGMGWSRCIASPMD